MMNCQDIEIVCTSQSGWLDIVARTYKNRKPLLLVDDAGFGIDPANQTLLEMAKQTRLSKRELAAVCVALGMGGIGIGMILLAFVDPEPTSKLGLLLGGVVTCILGRGLSAIRVLTKSKPPNIKLTHEASRSPGAKRNCCRIGATHNASRPQTYPLS